MNFKKCYFQTSAVTVLAILMFPVAYASAAELNSNSVTEPTQGDSNKPMVARTDKGSLDVELSLSPMPVEPDKETKLHIRFLQKGTEVVQPHIDYQVFASKDGNEVFRIPFTHTSEGVVTIPYAFNSTGSFVVGVEVYGILFQPIPKETATFPIVVVPEFPVGIILIAGLITGVSIFMTKMRRSIVGNNYYHEK